MSVSEDDVKKIAKLARLRLTEAEVALYGGQLTKILDSMAELAKADTTGVAPTTSVLGAVNVMRADEPKRCRRRARPTHRHTERVIQDGVRHRLAAVRYPARTAEQVAVVELARYACSLADTGCVDGAGVLQNGAGW